MIKLAVGSSLQLLPTHSTGGKAIQNAAAPPHNTPLHGYPHPGIPGSTLPSARFKLPPNATAYAELMDHQITTTCEVEQQRLRERKRAPEVSGKRVAEGAPPPQTIIKRTRCTYVEASCKCTHENMLQPTDTGIKPGPQTAYRAAQVSDRASTQTYKDTHPYLPGAQHGTLHTITNTHNAPPHTPSIAARNTHTNQYHPLAPTPNTATLPSPFKIPISTHIHHTIHTTTLNNPTRGHICTDIPSPAPIHTLHRTDSTFSHTKSTNRPLPLQPLSLDT